MIGAWVPHHFLTDVAGAIKRAKAAGLTDLCWIVNDASKQARGPAKWEPFNWTMLEAACAATKANGLGAHVMAWLVADEDYIDAMALDLNRHRHAYDVIHLDVEEPWVNRKGDAVELVKRLDLDAPMLVTAIGHTDFSRIAPVVQLAAGVIPQVYCTQAAEEKWGVTPGKSPARGIQRYRGHFPGVPIIIGLAAYDLAPGANRAAVWSAKTEGVEDRFYWSLETLHGPV